MAQNHQAGVSLNPSPTARAVRAWTGLLAALWLAVLCGAIITCYFQVQRYLYYGHRLDTPEGSAEPAEAVAAKPHPPGYWHTSAVALASAVLAMLFIVAVTGLILGAPWSWRLLLVGAILQIVATVVTQVWQATLPRTVGGFFADGELGVLGAATGIALWNVVPVGILILAASGGKRRAAAPYPE